MYNAKASPSSGAYTEAKQWNIKSQKCGDDNAPIIDDMVKTFRNIEIQMQEMKHGKDRKRHLS